MRQDYAKNVPALEECLAVFEEHLPASHHCSIQCFIHLARSYQHAEKWVASVEATLPKYLRLQIVAGVVEQIARRGSPARKGPFGRNGMG